MFALWGNAALPHVAGNLNACFGETSQEWAAQDSKGQGIPRGKRHICNLAVQLAVQLDLGNRVIPASKSSSRTGPYFR